MTAYAPRLLGFDDNKDKSSVISFQAFLSGTISLSWETPTHKSTSMLIRGLPF